MNSNFKKLLKSLSPFTDEELEKVSCHFQDIELSKNDYFVRAGHYCDRVAYIRSGYLRSYFIDKCEKEITTFFATPGTFIFDVRSFLKRVPSFENIQVIENCELTVIKRKDLDNLYHKNWKWQQVGRLTYEKYHVASEERAIALQTLSTKLLYEDFLNTYPDIIQKVPLGYIASYLGMSQETLSRIRGAKK